MMQLEREIRDRLERDAQAFRSRYGGPPRTMPKDMGRRIRRRQAGTVAAAVVVIALLTVGVGRLGGVVGDLGELRPAGSPLGGSDMVEVPPEGEVVPIHLPDGHPAFVVAHEDGTVSVVDAISTHAAGGVDKLLWWCPTRRVFEDPFHGSQFDERGGYLDGPGRAALPTYEAVPEGDDLRLVRIGERVVPSSRTPGEDPGDGLLCTQPEQSVFHRFEQSVPAVSAESLAAAPDGWIVLTGSVVLRDGRPPRLCADLHGGYCVSISSDETEFPRMAELTEQVWLVHVRGGKALELVRTIPPAGIPPR